MSEEQAIGGDAAVRTGVASVDAVLDEVDAASGLPVDEQVAVFERAHEQLRRALDADPDANPDVDPDPSA